MAPRLFLSSGDLVADRRYEFARDLQLKGDLPAAAELLEQAIELVPKFPSAWYTLGKIRLELGQREAAIAAFRAARDADPEDRHGAGLHLMQLGIEPVSSMPPGYVRTLFDQYAPRFEAALVGDLGYRGPALVCALYFVPVSGYIPDRPVIKYLAAQRNIEIAFVPIAGTRLLVPFRMTIPTPLGQAMLEATSFVTTAAPPRVAKTQ